MNNALPTSIFIILFLLTGCEPNTGAEMAKERPSVKAMTLNHSLGETIIQSTPKRVIALDMNAVDTLSQLNIPVIGMPKDFIPHFLPSYKNNSNVQDLGAIIQPNLERVYSLNPDLILISSLQATHYKALNELAPTYYFDIDYQNSGADHIEKINTYMLNLGRIFNKQELAQEKVATLNAKLKDTKQLITDRPESAMIVLHNNGTLRYFGVQSRYGFIYNELGVKPASQETATSAHGQPISHEFMYKYNPDIIYVIDRTAVMENKAAVNLDDLNNPLLKKTNAWKNNRVRIVDSEAWYITGASYSSLMIMLDDITQGYVN
ncbi:siderophore ABC transporter substrate-binding protein [Pseudoalteromonas sp. KG3]|uniref:Siderophore ABC transporter substrate-binding protein n=2 Tax=Bacteria TaxID=2 RepID=A0ABR9FME6_9GAMM|nr:MULTISPECIES: siderophore ABC transporter substrate-binding protein [Pseudoalteromonas]MBE0457972.1 siderophore ABC transporter substrate-binding protein [Pseudoalteromonas prydzensis]WKD22479.1 siderophore ABC transporter substrate-binding protein [Pseudoalteromonas sp. KG3]